MNIRTRRLLQDFLIAIILSVVFGMIEHRVAVTPFAFIMTPLVWLGLRHGGAWSVIAAAFSGIIVSFIGTKYFDITHLLLNGILPLMGVGLSGLFARNTQRTLNNLRYSSTYLNIFTAYLLVLIVYYSIKFGLLSWMDHTPFISIKTLLLGLGITWLISSAGLSLLAKTMPKVIIPRRSKYLPRRETSSLLND